MKSSSKIVNLHRRADPSICIVSHSDFRGKSTLIAVCAGVSYPKIDAAVALY